MTTALVALGSNLANPIQQIRAAFAALDALPHTRLVRHSSLYRTPPIGFLEQPDFINAVAELETALTPESLLEGLLQIEAESGRVRTFINAPRILDLDLLWHDGVSINSDRLTLPHPRMHERAFVLLPLQELAPNLQLAERGTVSALLSRLDISAIVRQKEDTLE